MTKKLVVWDSLFLPTAKNHGFFVKKLSLGFEQHGFQVRKSKYLRDLRSAEFVIVSNHTLFEGSAAGALLGRCLPRFVRIKLGESLQFLAIRRIAGRMNPSGTLIAWYWHKHEDHFVKLGVRYVLIGEFFQLPPRNPSYREWFDRYTSSEHAVGVEFASAYELTDHDQQPREIDVLYVGNRLYEPSWQQAFEREFGSSCQILGTPPYIPESRRLDLYRRSKIVLGLHGGGNVSNSVVVERVYEAIALGAVVISNNPAASPATGGVALVAGSPDEAVKLAREVLDSPAEWSERVAAGLSFSRAQGLYEHRADLIIKAAEAWHV